MKNPVIFSAGLALLLLAGCVSKEEHAKLKTELDSVQFELEAAQKAVYTLHEVGVLIDSVDAASDELQMDMELGTSLESYKARMQNIKTYISQTEQKLDQLQIALEKSEANRRAYANTVKKLRSDLAKRGEEIERLQAQVETYKTENKDLLTTLDLKSNELQEKSDEIEQKKEELAMIEARIDSLQSESKMTEADAFYARAEAVEEAARRTKLAPKKKKQTYQEAITLYQEALALGRSDAQDKINALQEKI
ncbi:MAG: hypothetical protein MJA30_18465 [Cytophagales bacterium]|nr:hypothetical protein [Cytophagales bacterium]